MMRQRLRAAFVSSCSQARILRIGMVPATRETIYRCLDPRFVFPFLFGRAVARATNAYAKAAETAERLRKKTLRKFAAVSLFLYVENNRACA